MKKVQEIDLEELLESCGLFVMHSDAAHFECCQNPMCYTMFTSASVSSKLLCTSVFPELCFYDLLL